MTGGSLGPRNGNGSNGSLPFPSASSSFIISRKASSMMLSQGGEKERFFPYLFRFLCRKKVAMLILVALALFVFVFGLFTVIKVYSTAQNVEQSGRKYGGRKYGGGRAPPPSDQPRPAHPCENFAFPPPAPPEKRRPGPRLDESPIQTEPHGGSDFGGYPSLKQRDGSFDIQESMTVHCGFVRGSYAGRQTGFDINEDDPNELQQPHDVVVASAIFGNYDLLQHPTNISEEAKKNVPFYMFVDEETEACVKENMRLDNSTRVGLWRTIVVHNVPYTNARRNGKEKHRDVLEQQQRQPPAAPLTSRRDSSAAGRAPARISSRRAKDRKSGSRRRR